MQNVRFVAQASTQFAGLVNVLDTKTKALALNPKTGKPLVFTAQDRAETAAKALNTLAEMDAKAASDARTAKAKATRAKNKDAKSEARPAA